MDGAESCALVALRPANVTGTSLKQNETPMGGAGAFALVALQPAKIHDSQSHETEASTATAATTPVHWSVRAVTPNRVDVDHVAFADAARVLGVCHQSSQESRNSRNAKSNRSPNRSSDSRASSDVCRHC